MESDRLRVMLKDEPAGWLERSSGSSIFQYDHEWLDRHGPPDRGVAHALPPRPEPYETAAEGGMPAFFINLLPEGDLLRRLSRRAKIGKDDLFGFLGLLGGDAVGDAWIEPRGPQPMLRLDLDAEGSFKEAYRRLLSEAALPLPQDAIAGAQPKISASRITLPVRAGPSAFLKLSLDPTYPLAAENEHFFMQMAAACGVRAAKTEIVRDNEGKAALLVHRFDRLKRGRKVQRLHQEDVCQLLDIYPADKYHVPVEEAGEIVQRVVAAPAPAGLELLAQFAFGYLIGNHDQHAKNVSILEGADGLWGLSPIYDMLCTLAYGDHFLALKLNGSDEELSRADFLALARHLGVREAAVVKRLDSLLALARPWLERLSEIGFDRLLTERLQGALFERAEALQG